MQALVQKVDSLEHDLSYLKLKSNLDKINSDIAIFINEVDIKSLEIRLFNSNNIFISKLSDMYQQYYQACQRKQQAYHENIEATKLLFEQQLTKYPYSESEMDVLNKSSNVIDMSYESLEAAINFLKSAIDTYKESCK